MAYVGAPLVKADFSSEITVSGDVTVDTNVLVVDTTNNRVGIGTASPDEALHIASAGKIKASRSDNTRSMLLYTDNSAATVESDTDPLKLKSADRIAFETGGANERMRIASDGKVGIGTTSPTGDGATLHLDGSIAYSTLHLTNSTTGGGAADGTYVTTSGNNFLLRNRENGYTAIYTNNTERMNITSTGAVNLTGFANGQINFASGNAANGAKIQTFNDAGTGDGYLAFEGYTKEYARFDSSGNLLVGKTAVSFSTQGVALRNNRVQATNNGGSPLELNRLTSDGDIILMQKDGATVGSIGVKSSDVYMQGPTNHAGIQFNTDGILPFRNGALANNTLDIGHTDYRWQDVYLSGNINMLDNDRIRLGTGDDLQIYHNGSHSFIDETGTGDLYIKGGAKVVVRSNGDEDMIVCNTNADVQLYYNGANRLKTTGAGVEVSGRLQASNLHPYNAGGHSGNTNVWWKIGTLSSFSGSKSAEITVYGTNSYSQNSNIAGKTTLLLRASNDASTTEAFFYSETMGNAGITNAAWKKTANNTFEIYVRVGTYQGLESTAITSGAWTPSVTSTGSGTQPASSTLFETNYNLQIQGSTKLQANTSGVTLGDTGNGVFKAVSGDYGSIEIDSGAHNGYEGYSIGGRVVFMHNNATASGIFNDVNNHWMILMTLGGAVDLYHNNSAKLSTTSSGAVVYGWLDSNEGIRHNNDTDTSLTFDTNQITLTTAGASRFRVESGGNLNFNVEGSNNFRSGIDLRQGSAKVWSAHETIGTAATYDSYNQTSLTDLGTARARVTINNNMNNGNYAISGGTSYGYTTYSQFQFDNQDTGQFESYNSPDYNKNFADGIMHASVHGDLA